MDAGTPAGDADLGAMPDAGAMPDGGAVPDGGALPDVAGRALGGSVAWCNDEFFADVHTLLSAAPPAHDPAAFGPRGKVYDGWETRRRRTPGDDAVIVRLAAPALVRAVHVDTAFFRGNFPEAAAVDGVAFLGHPDAGQLREAPWTALAGWTPLAGDTVNVLPAEGPDRLVTHVRLRIRPDGGVARLRVLGEVLPDPRWLGGRPDLAATLTGGRVVDCSNMFYASPAHVLAPGRAAVMSDGWETARRRGPGNDWLVVRLGAPGLLHDAVVDTSRFVGNAPGWARLTDADTGRELLPRTALVPDTVHRFRLLPGEPVRAVRLDIYPDGGIARLHVHGEVDPASRAAVADRWLSLLPPDQAAGVRPDELFS
jgi:allantoicase